MPSVFLSHSHKDRTFVRRLSADLRDHGIRCWIDEADIDVGESLLEKITEAIQDVDYVCAVISRSSIESRWVQEELRLALHREIEGGGVRVLPILIEDVVPPDFLKPRLYADFRADYAKGLSLILRRICGDVTKTPHFPLLRSIEIPCSASSFDQIPALDLTEDELGVLWPEIVDWRTELFLYRFKRSSLELSSATPHEFSAECTGYEVFSLNGELKGFAVLRDGQAPSESLWELPSSHGSQTKKLAEFPEGSTSLAKFRESVVLARNDGHQISFFAPYTKRSLVVPIEYGLSPGPAYTVGLDDRLIAVFATPKGIAWVVIDSAVRVSSTALVLPFARQRRPGTASRIHLDPVLVYDHCVACVDDRFFLVYVETDKEIRIAELAPDGRLVDTHVVCAPDPVKKSVLKPSIAGNDGVLVASWHVRNLEFGTTSLECQAFLLDGIEQLWAYPRVLTAMPSVPTGTPITMAKRTAFVGYSEHNYESFKVKISLLDLIRTGEF